MKLYNLEAVRGLAALYLLMPIFVFRLMMYFSIWWSGVHLSNVYLSNQKKNFKSVKNLVVCLSVICGFLSAKVIYLYDQGGQSRFGVSPFLELRYFAFDLLIKPFAIFAPISYVMYISHYYVWIGADYLFSYLFEMKAYPFIKNRLIDGKRLIVGRSLNRNRSTKI
ncbi:hypothetical protein [Vibrio splendidus]|uniref:hypothetical protein n=1 Tax=Vibrio splendidus TaxID=29497 RepID=UPI00246869BC|nr:hypothetical protein [Vibrio splendidus]MDH5897661.1 hypothetical protein [Vibrio splendidus]